MYSELFIWFTIKISCLTCLLRCLISSCKWKAKREKLFCGCGMVSNKLKHLILYSTTWVCWVSKKFLLFFYVNFWKWLYFHYYFFDKNYIKTRILKYRIYMKFGRCSKTLHNVNYFIELVIIFSLLIHFSMITSENVYIFILRN